MLRNLLQLMACALACGAHLSAMRLRGGEVRSLRPRPPACSASAALRTRKLLTGARALRSERRRRRRRWRSWAPATGGLRSARSSRATSSSATSSTTRRAPSHAARAAAPPTRGAGGSWRRARETDARASQVRMWVFEEEVDGQKLTEIINTQHENVKYLPVRTATDPVPALGHRAPVPWLHAADAHARRRVSSSPRMWSPTRTWARRARTPL